MIPGAAADPTSALLAALTGPTTGQPVAPPGPPPADQQQTDPLATLQECIQGIHELEATLPDHKHTALASEAKLRLLRIQSDLMGAQQQAGSAQETLARQLGA